MQFEEAYAQLNPDQKAAVDSTEGPVMVLAGPGTGKTQILALRIAKILRITQMNPYNILCLTFTESAVVEMRKRLIEFIGPTAYAVRIHTFHSFCNEVIQEFPEKFLFARELTPLTDLERIQLFREILDRQPDASPLKPFAHPYFYVKELVKLIQDLKRENIAPSQLQKALAEIYEAYQNNLLKQGRYDFEDMIGFVVKKFKEDSELLAHYQEQFQYILVDEYQDTNGAQNEVLGLLGSFFDNPNIFVVGDDKQSIYRFQGASTENLVGFYRLYEKSVQLIAIKENYRSQQTILDAAQSLITHNEESLSKYIPGLDTELHSAALYDRKPLRVAELESPSSERYFLARELQRLIQAGTPPSEIAVIYRNHRDAEVLTELFLRMKLPFRLLAGQDVLKDKSIQKLLGLLRLVADLTDERQLFCVLQYDFFKFPSLELLRLTRKASESQKSLFEMLREKEPFASFSEKLMEWSQKSINRPLVEFFDLLLKESGYLDSLLEKENKLELLNRLNTLLDELKTWNTANPELTLKDFVAYLDLLKEHALPLEARELRTQKEAVQLMTAHKSKGQEFEHVFIMNCVDKHWGNMPKRSLIKLPENFLKIPSHAEKNEEERRLFYVALTRAKKSVTLTYAKQNEQGSPTVPSVFLAEIKPEYFEKCDTSAVDNEALSQLPRLFLTTLSPIGGEEKAFFKALLDQYTLSVTHLNNYLRCPRLFYYNNLLRVPRVKTKQEAFGTAIHESLKDLFLELEEKKTPKKAFLIDQFERHLKREILSKQEFRGGLELGQRVLTEYYDHYKAHLSPRVLLEYDFFSHGVQVEGTPITGKLDKIEILDETAKTVNVVDYKTGNPDSKAAELGPKGAYRRQIIFYKLLCDSSPKFPYKMVSGEIDFVQKSKKKDAFIKKTFTVTPEELQDLKSLIQSVYADIRELRFLRPEAKACGDCEWCKAAR